MVVEWVVVVVEEEEAVVVAQAYCHRHRRYRSNHVHSPSSLRLRHLQHRKSPQNHHLLHLMNQRRNQTIHLSLHVSAHHAHWQMTNAVFLAVAGVRVLQSAIQTERTSDVTGESYVVAVAESHHHHYHCHWPQRWSEMVVDLKAHQGCLTT